MANDGLSLTESKDRDICVVTAAGRIDSSNAGSFMSRLTDLIASGSTKILIDLGSVMYLTSAAFRALLVAKREIAGKNGTLGLCGLNGQVRELFEIGGLIELFSIYPSREDALGKLA